MAAYFHIYLDVAALLVSLFSAEMRDTNKALAIFVEKSFGKRQR
jgi:hypothetical protein